METCMYVYEEEFLSYFFFPKEIQGPRKVAELPGRPLAQREGGAALVPSPRSLLSVWA